MIEQAQNGKQYVEIAAEKAAQYNEGDFYTVQTLNAYKNPNGLARRSLKKAVANGELEHVGCWRMGFRISGKGKVFTVEPMQEPAFDQQRLYGEREDSTEYDVNDETVSLVKG